MMKIRPRGFSPEFHPVFKSVSSEFHVPFTRSALRWDGVGGNQRAKTKTKRKHKDKNDARAMKAPPCAHKTREYKREYKRR